MIYLYGLAEAGPSDVLPALEGAMGLQSALEVERIGSWSLIHSAQDDAEITPKRRLMLTHTKVLERLLPAAPVLPARFGLVAASVTEAARLIDAQHDQISAAFERIRGCVELGIRVSFDRQHALLATLEAEPALRRERDALSRRGAEAQYAMAEFGGRLADLLDRRRGVAQSALLDALRPVARDHVLRAPDNDTQVLRAEFLIEAGAQDAFIQALEEAAFSLPFAADARPEIQIIGPAPFYHFVHLHLTDQQSEVAA
ncbi:GvpL/GvpF family gas vesicle protein [uncultured Sulfitobacter sp.]|uniref:GvpL/GvpF family gas vesicle protein n=1 Tax=uncultured Sulfitobacter sp. TaxID=191468 RepID=UPI0026288E35|nr:GvpL/GvpF family gas vesicle protein [uncultured Sulfitobacter sp.]